MGGICHPLVGIQTNDTMGGICCPPLLPAAWVPHPPLPLPSVMVGGPTCLTTTLWIGGPPWQTTYSSLQCLSLCLLAPFLPPLLASPLTLRILLPCRPRSPSWPPPSHCQWIVSPFLPSIPVTTTSAPATSFSSGFALLVFPRLVMTLC
jgi:hypothetical protein